MLTHNPIPQSPPTVPKVYADLFDAGKPYWTEYAQTPSCKDLLAYLCTAERQRNAEFLFMMGFVSGLRFCNPRSLQVQGKLGVMLRCALLWHTFLQTCLGEVVLDGPPFPMTPETLLDMALRLFVDGFNEGQRELARQNVQ